MLFNLNIVPFTHYSFLSIIILDHKIIYHPVYNGLNKSYIHSQFFQFHIYILDRVVIANCEPDHITPIHLSPLYKKYLVLNVFERSWSIAPFIFVIMFSSFLLILVTQAFWHLLKCFLFQMPEYTFAHNFYARALPYFSLN